MELRALFEPFGLVYSVKLVNSEVAVDTQTTDAVGTQEKPEKHFGFVTFYSVGAARLAFKKFHKNSWKDKNSMYVQFSRKRKREDGHEEEKIPLPIHSALELANHYLGFDTWSSSIVGGINRIEVDECAPEVKLWAERRFADQNAHLKPQQKLATKAMAYKCKIAYQFEDGHRVEAEGHGMAIGLKADEIIPLAKKIAVTHARKAAFARMVIVVLNKKVGIRILANGPPKPHLLTEAEFDVNVKETDLEHPAASSEVGASTENM